VGHVVGGVADVGQRIPGRAAEPFPDRQQVGEELARVVPVGERVDHRYRRGRGERRQPLVGEGPDHDRVHVPRQHPRRVLDRLAPAEVRGLRVDDHRVPAELGDADLERDPGAQRRLLEDDRDRPAPQRLAVDRCEVEDGGLLHRAEVVVAQEVRRHGVPPARRGS
jgi:hypothetical protein